MSAQPRLRKLRQTEDETVLAGPEYRERLRAQFEKIPGGAPAWAATMTDDSDGMVLTRSAAPLLRDSMRTLAPTALDCTRSKDANQASVSQVGPRAVGCLVVAWPFPFG